ncbi:MAG TPA: chromosome segregation protein SMC [Thermomicrobiales bacterium]|nr:chromosome segregation protein SMC [Thermomicrobiales bacterium]
MGLLLKQLDIHGFKSFATPTTFVFDRGITAIIGPNGSGKSNVAEALRWVLGEQGHANLRSRRTEDVIFAGSDKRSQQSLAEVTLVLDNSDGSLPLAFSEVTVSRRAFRSGESQYLINGGRVRLKDVQQLVAPLGQAYTIIGQGLVDAALSQRPEERRGLFEHAAGISGLRLQANDAERSLLEAMNNAQRLRDILGELEPRVRSLERSARLAREYGAVRDRLRSAQRLQYAHQWAGLSERLDDAQRALKRAESACDEQSQSQSRVTSRLSELRGGERRVLNQIAALEEQLRSHEQELVRARHQLDLLDTRSRANSERVADLRASLLQMEQERAEALAELDAHRVELSNLIDRAAAIELELRERDAVIAEATARREETLASLAHAEQLVIDISRTAAGLEGQLQSLVDRKASLQRELSQVEALEKRADTDRAELERTVSAQSDRAEALRAALDNVFAASAAIERRIAGELEKARDTTSKSDHDERELATLRARLDVLERTHLSGEGLYTGVRAVLRAVRRGAFDLPGLVGVLTETIEVPPRYEVAVEVALGAHLQDIVVQRWSDARDAIDYLKREGAGRATFQPLDTVRAPRARRLDVSDPDLLGIAASLIDHTSDVAVVIEQLLGGTLIVTDLDASRRLITQLDGWTIVTLSGEITRPAGSVTGGARTAEAGLLARERERRSLPETIAETDARLTEAREQAREQVARLDALRHDRDSLTATAEEQRRELNSLHTDIDRAVRDLAVQKENVDRGRRRLEELTARLDELNRTETSTRGELTSLTEQRDERAAEARQLQASLQSHSIDSDPRAADLRSELAAARERIRSTESLTRQLTERATRLEQAMHGRATEAQRLADSEAELNDERRLARLDIQRLELLIATRRESLPPLQGEQARLSDATGEAEVALDQSIAALREGERERDRATLNVARAQDERVFLVERIRNDLELDDPSVLARDARDPTPAPDDQEIARLRERLRRMAVVGPDVVEQYDAESERLAFLSQQLTDVDGAALGLRKVLDELNGKMATRFTATFRDVAASFEQTFARLFGGGSARLVYSDSDDGAPGIDIVAQPPGKRLQSLNALSGGERALTAVALLIAIQRVNPSPFCLLDEVDAALDESNVLRFRDEVRDLSESTQFVLITHNRGTIEGADTLYGVTMGDDGISRVLSLRLDDAIAAVAAFDAAG